MKPLEGKVANNHENEAVKQYLKKQIIECLEQCDIALLSIILAFCRGLRQRHLD